MIARDFRSLVLGVLGAASIFGYAAAAETGESKAVSAPQNSQADAQPAPGILAEDPSRYWDIWQGARREARLGELATGIEHYEQAFHELQRAKAVDVESRRRLHSFNEIALLNEWETACYEDGRVGRGFTVHQQALGAAEDFLRAYHEGRIEPWKWPPQEASVWLGVQLDTAKYQEARGDVLGAMNTLRTVIGQLEPLAGTPNVGTELSRARNNLATLYLDLGDDEAAITLLTEALARASDKDGPSVLKLNLARLRSQMEGPSAERIAEARTLVAGFKARHEYSHSISAQRRLAVMLYYADEKAEALQLLDDLLTEVRQHPDLPHEMDLLLWRAKVMMGEGKYDGLEADLMRVLKYQRERGLVIEIFDVNRTYARLLSAQNRMVEALRIYHQTLHLSRALQAHALTLELLVDIAGIYEKLGDPAQTQRIWNDFDALLAQHPEVKGWRRLAVMMSKLHYFQRTGREDKTRAFYATVADFVRATKLTSYRRRSFDEFHLDSGSPKSLATANATDGLKPTVDLQPVTTRTEVPPGEPARCRFTLSNPATTAESGTLTLSGVKVTSVQRDDAKGELTFFIAPAGDAASSWSEKLSLASEDQLLINLESTPVVKDAENSAQLTWQGLSAQTVSWTSGTALGGTVYAINANAVALNPFYAVPVYHELYVNDVTLRAIPIRVQASRPCRVEIYEVTGSVIAVDADGNGSFLDRGDALYQSRDGLAEVSVEKGANAAAFEFQVFMLDGDSRDLKIEVQVRDGADWKTQAIDQITPFKKI